jgi:hypothetical protein
MPETWLNERLEEAKLFNLPLLFKNGEEFELRICPSQAAWLRFGIAKDIFVFKLDSLGWSGFHYYSYTSPTRGPDGLTWEGGDSAAFGKNTFLVKKIKPLCGWEQFADSIGYFKIEHLPTQGLISGFKDKGILDGHGYHFEISRPNSYRFLAYHNPQSYEYEECKKIEAFMDMMRRQLGSDYYWPERLTSDSITSESSATSR